MSLPERPNLEQLRRQAKELRAAEGIPLSTAQLRIARHHGFTSWARLKAEVEALVMDRAQRAAEFIAASINGRTGRAQRLLAGDPGVAQFSAGTAAVLGDISYIRTARVDLDETLKLVAQSHWHQIEPARADGMLAVARFLLDAGADPDGALYGASGIANNPAITSLLLERGANPNDGESLYHSAYHAPDLRCLRLLVSHGAKVNGSNAIGAILDTGDAEGLQLLLSAGGSPGEAMAGAVLQHAIRRECTAAVLESLLVAGADPNFQDCHPYPPLRMAVRFGRTDLVALLLKHGAVDSATDTDRFIGACAQVDRSAAQQLADAPLTPADLTMIVYAAELGHVDTVRLMLDLGFPVDIHRDRDGATPLHAAAYAGRADLIRLLIARGADANALDTEFGATPLCWATVGSGEHDEGDWPTVIELLLAAGATTTDIWVASKPPSDEVAALLHTHGLAPDTEL
jgi:ankyrin repeat protein